MRLQIGANFSEELLVTVQLDADEVAEYVALPVDERYAWLEDVAKEFAWNRRGDGDVDLESYEYLVLDDPTEET